MKKGMGAKVLTAAVFFIFLYVFFCSLFSLGESLHGKNNLKIDFNMNIENPEEVVLRYSTDGQKYDTLPVSVTKGAGGDAVVSFGVPKGNDGMYTLSFGENTGKIRISDIVFSSLFCKRIIDAEEASLYFTGGLEYVSANGLITIENVPAGSFIETNEPINKLVTPAGGIFILFCVSVLMAILFTFITSKIIKNAGDAALGPIGLTLGYLAAFVMAFFVFTALYNGFPALELDSSSVKKIKDPLLIPAAPSVTESVTEVPTAPVYDETVPQPLKKDEKPVETAEWNKPKAPLENIKEGFVSNGICVGKTDGSDGQWLFWNDELEDFYGNNLFSSSQLSRSADNLSAYREWLKERGIELYVVLCPNKSTVYPEFLPDGYISSGNSRYDQFIDYFAANCPDLNIIDVRDAVTAEKEKNFPVYYRLDTHWNNYGGFAAYQKIIQRISEDFPSVCIMKESDYNVDFFDSYMKDGAWYLGYYDYFSELGPVYTPVSKTGTELAYIRKENASGIFLHSYTQANGYNDYNTYSVFENNLISEAPSVYMLRDSFGISLSQFMKDSFSKSVFKWSSEYEKADIEKQKPDIVIIEVVERELDSLVKQNFR